MGGSLESTLIEISWTAHRTSLKVMKIKKEVIREEVKSKYDQLPYMHEREGLFCTSKYTLIKRK